jgi:hypothetical protein
MKKDFEEATPPRVSNFNSSTNLAEGEFEEDDDT